MKKVINGAEYNTETAEMICEITSREVFRRAAEDSIKVKQLFTTKSGKYFFFTVWHFTTMIVVNNCDLNPIYEEEDVQHCTLIPIDYDEAFEFIRGVKDSNVTWDQKFEEKIRKYFPDVFEYSSDYHGMDLDKKLQKKFYLSTKASWYLDMMVTELDGTNSSIVERLINKEYKRLYLEGIIERNPFGEFGEEDEE